MEIQRLTLLKGSREARGISVVIDVFRAFTCEPLLYYYGVNRIILESDIDRCRAMKGDYIRIGESDEVPIEGFDLTNSPYLIMMKGRNYFYRKDVIHRTTSGVTGALNALEHSDEVLLASFVNARATVEYIKHRNPDLVSIVAMGIRSRVNAPEDDYCGDYIESLLTGNRYDHAQAVSAIIQHETAQKFLRGDKIYLPREDPLLCLQRDLFYFALQARKCGDVVESVRCNICQ
jgi:2-phosphosulfolactate phosphatase